MAIYCVLADLENRFPGEDLAQLTDDEGTGAVVQEVIDAAVADAGELIDGYLRGVTSLPLQVPIPGVIKRVCIDLVMYDLHARRGGDIPPVVQARYEDSREALEQVQRRKLVLQYSGEATVDVQSSSYLTDKTSSDKVFTSDTLDKF